MDEELRLPAFNYYIDESGPDILVLRRQGGAFVAAFTAHVATRQCILEAAKADYRAVVEANKDTLGGLPGRARRLTASPTAWAAP